MAMLDPVQKILATSPTPLAAATIAELTGWDESRVEATLVELAQKDLVRRVNHRWVAGHAAPSFAQPTVRA